LLLFSTTRTFSKELIFVVTSPEASARSSTSIHALLFPMNLLTLSNPIFLPTAYSPALVLGGKEVGGLLVIILQF
jgi:hypothetical protein